MTNAPGKSINPEWKADSPRIFWIYKGKTISAPIIAMLVTPDKMAATVKTFDLKTRNSKKGCSKCNCRYVKRHKTIAPTIKNP